MVSDYTGPMRAGAPAGSPSQYTDPKQIDAVLKSSDPGAVAEAGRSYQKFAQAYEKISGHLLSLRDDLNDAWGGDDAAAAQSQLREVWSAATTVHKTAHAFGSAIETHGSEYLAWYKNNKPPSTSLAEAQSWMTGANERVTQSWSSLPPDLSTTLPPGETHFVRSPATSGSPAGTAGGGGSGLGGTGLGGGHHLPGSISDLPKDHSGAGGSGTELAGLPTSGGNPGSGFGLPAGGAPPFSSGGGYVAGSEVAPSGDGIIGLGPGSPGVPGAVTGGGLRGATSAAAETAEAEAATAESRAVAGAGGAMGPTAGGSGAKEHERTRRTWLAEDKEVWSEDIEVSPEIIGAVHLSAVDREEESGIGSVDETESIDDDEELAALLAELSDHTAPEASEDGPADLSEQITELKEKLARLERQRDAERGLHAPTETGSERGWHSGDGF